MNGRARFTDGSRLRGTARPAACEQSTHAADAMERCVVVPSWIAVASLVAGSRTTGRYPVLDAHGVLVGTLDLAVLAGRPELHDRLAGEVCLPLDGQVNSSLVVGNGRLFGALGRRVSSQLGRAS